MSDSYEIVFENRSGVEVDEALLEGVARAVLERTGMPAGELGLVLVDETEMAGLNLTHMDRQGPTDVLSFPMDSEAGEGALAPGVPVLLGDVVVSPQVAAAQAGGHGNTEAQELCLLVIHGVLHVAGYDHETDEGQMEELQERLFGELCG